MRASAIYEGTVRHVRRGPRERTFRYGLVLCYLDLDELPRLFDGRWLWSYERPNVVSFRRADYLGDPDVPLRDAVRARAAEGTGVAPSGPIRMLTMLRHLGYCFNPVTFYYCFEEKGGLACVVAEITNTPWGERHSYVLPAASGAADARARFAKAFHVSPFLDMDLDYDWRFTPPGESLGVAMSCGRSGREVFRTDLALERRPWGASSLARALARRPAAPQLVHAAIYRQALALFLRRTPFFVHPSQRADTAESPS